MPGLTYDIDLQLRPFDRLSLEVRRGATRLGGGIVPVERLTETVTELSTAYFFSARLYLAADVQLSDTRRRFPAAPRERGSIGNVQLTWEASRNLAAYFGMRSGGNAGEREEYRGRTIKIYLKVSRTLRTHL